MYHFKTLITIFILSLLVIAGTANSSYKKSRNLKVLPADITDTRLDSLMESYSKGLGVDCQFCHSPNANDKNITDFASDANPVKEEARKMMRLTMDINKNYFNYDSNQHPAFLQVVGCATCHKGNAVPQ